MTPTPPVALTIAGFDGSAGAGIGADWKTFAAHDVYGVAALTAVTCQNTRGVSGVETLQPEWLAQQLSTLREDFDIAAIKLGMLAGEPQVRALVRTLPAIPAPVVCDPVFASQHGEQLLDSEGRAALRALLPHVAVLTPNMDEAAALLEIERDEIERDPRSACSALRALGPGAVVLKGGHRQAPHSCEDALLDGEDWHVFRVPRVATTNDHGTGCTYSAALCARLARGETLPAAARGAQQYVHRALDAARTWTLGHGRGPLHHVPDRTREPG